MVELSHWQNIVVPQKHMLSGCIPTGYEWLIRYLNIQGVRLDIFQEVFDLERWGQISCNPNLRGSFTSVSEFINQIYPQIQIRILAFKTGIEKVNTIRYLISHDIPCIVSIAKTDGGWHIAPAISIDDSVIKVIWDTNQGTNVIVDYPIDYVIQLHDRIAGGNDISWIMP